MFCLLMPWRNRVDEAVTDELLLRLERFLACHRELPRRVEPDFINLGQTLQTLHAETEAVSRQTREIIALLGINREESSPTGGDHRDSDSQAGTMDELRHLIGNALQQLTLRRQEINTNLEIVQTIHRRLGELAAQGKTLHKLGLHLGVVGLNIGVESTRSTAIWQLFTGIAPELRQVSGHIRQVAKEIDDDCRQQQQQQQTLGITTAANLKNLSTLVAEAEQAVTEALEHTAMLTDQALSALLAAEKHGAEMAAQLARVIIDIQLHDSMSQRIAHIVEALESVQQDLHGLAGNKEPQLRRRKLAAARRIIDLQQQQVGHLVRETTQAHQDSGQALQAIEGSFKNLEQHLLNSHLNHPNQGFSLAPLQNALARLDGLLGQSTVMIERLNDSAMHAASLSQRLNKHMDKIEKIRWDVHLKALNTIVMASHLGEEGHSMEVLAQETKKLSDLAHDFVTGIDHLHRQITRSVEHLNLADNGATAQTEARASDHHRLQDISANLELFSQQTAGAGRQAEQVGHGLTEAGQKLNFLAQLQSDLATDQRLLAEMSDLLAPFAANADETFADEETEHLETLYTMEKERQLHRTVLGSPPDPRPSQPAAGATAASAPTPAPTPATATASNIELF